MAHEVILLAVGPQVHVQGVGVGEHLEQGNTDDIKYWAFSWIDLS